MRSAECGARNNLWAVTLDSGGRWRAGAEKRVAPLADSWKAIGAEVEIVIVPAARSDPEYRVTFPGVGITGNIWDGFFTNVLHSKHAAAPANRWVGANRAGYANPAVDSVLEKLVVTIAPAERGRPAPSHGGRGDGRRSPHPALLGGFALARAPRYSRHRRQCGQQQYLDHLRVD